MKAQNNVVDTVNDVFGKVIKTVSMEHYYGIVINRGERDGISSGDRFLIYEAGEELFDPDTQESLGKLEIVKGIAKPKHIQESVTTLIPDEYLPSTQIKKRLIPKGVGVLYPPLTHQEEEIIESLPPEPISFRDVKVGDLVKPMKRKIS